MAIRYSCLEVILTDFKRIKRYFIKRWFAEWIISLSKKLGKTGWLAKAPRWRQVCHVWGTAGRQEGLAKGQGKDDERRGWTGCRGQIRSGSGSHGRNFDTVSSMLWRPWKIRAGKWYPLICKVHSVCCLGNRLQGVGMEAGHQLEVGAAVQAEIVTAGTQLVTIKAVRRSPIPNHFFRRQRELRFVKCSGFPLYCIMRWKHSEQLWWIRHEAHFAG